MKVSHIGSTYGRHTPIRACIPGTQVSYGSWLCLSLGSVVSPLIAILDLLAQIIWFYLDLIYSLFKDEDMGTMISNRHIWGVGQYAGWEAIDLNIWDPEGIHKWTTRIKKCGEEWPKIQGEEGTNKIIGMWRSMSAARAIEGHKTGKQRLTSQR